MISSPAIVRFLLVASILCVLTNAASAQSKKKLKQAKSMRSVVLEAVPDRDQYIDVQFEPRLLTPLQLVYPEKAKSKGLEGKVTLCVLIGRLGTADRFEIEKVTDSIFLKPAIEALQHARFSPAIQNGNPVPAWWTLSALFSMHDDRTSIGIPIGALSDSDVPTRRIAMIPVHADSTRGYTIFYSDAHRFGGVPNAPVLRDSFIRYIHYPERALQKGLEGSVVVKYHMDHRGRVGDVQVDSATDPIFIQPALDAFAHARYDPPSWYDYDSTTYLHETVPFMLEHALDHTYAEIPGVPKPEAETKLVREPRSLYEQRVDFPAEARTLGIQGVVNVSALINVHGIVEETSVEESSNPVFNNAAMAAVEHMLFEPAMNTNGPVKTWWTVPVVFRMRR